MFRILFATVLSVALLAGSAARATERTVTLAVDGMSCARCPYMVRTALEEIPGVAHAGVSYVEKTAVVTFDDAKTMVAGIDAGDRRYRLPFALEGRVSQAMADDIRQPSYAVRPGVTFPDWTVVTSPTTCDALLAIFEAFGVERVWRDYMPVEDGVRAALLRLYAEQGRTPTIDEALQAGRAIFAPSLAGLEVNP